MIFAVIENFFKLSSLLILCLIILYVILYLKGYLYISKMAKNIVNLRGPISVPVFGTAYVFIGKSDKLKALEDVMTKYKSNEKPVPMWIGSSLVLLCSRPEDIKTLYNSPYAVNKSSFYKFLKHFGGQGLITAPVETWRKHRKVINPFFHAKSIESLVPDFKRLTDILRDELETKMGEEFDIFDSIAACTLDIMTECILGVRLNLQNDKNTYKYGRAFGSVMEIINDRVFNVLLHPSLTFKLSGLQNKMLDKLDILKSLRDRVLNANIKEKANNVADKLNTKPDNLLDSMLKKLKEDAQNKWSIEELNDELNTFFIAGTDSVNTSIGFVVMMLGIHQNVQTKVHKEIVEVLGESNRPIEIEDLRRLQYLDQVVKETLRLYPTAALTSRAIEKDIELDSCTVPAGCEILVDLKYVQTDKTIWGEDADKFDPDRFSPENSLNRHPYAYIPFAAGPRTCIGLRFAMVITKYIVAEILRNFKIGSRTKFEDLQVSFYVTLSLVGGYNVSLQKRT